MNKGILLLLRFTERGTWNVFCTCAPDDRQAEFAGRYVLDNFTLGCHDDGRKSRGQRTNTGGRLIQ
jgi:hypothetical protein